MITGDARYPVHPYNSTNYSHRWVDGFCRCGMSRRRVSDDNPYPCVAAMPTLNADGTIKEDAEVEQCQTIEELKDEIDRLRRTMRSAYESAVMEGVGGHTLITLSGELWHQKNGTRWVSAEYMNNLVRDRVEFAVEKERARCLDIVKSVRNQCPPSGSFQEWALDKVKSAIEEA